MQQCDKIGLLSLTLLLSMAMECLCCVKMMMNMPFLRFPTI